MKTTANTIAIFLISACAHMAPASAQIAQGTWRCGNTYTDQPCKGGKEVSIDDARSEADRQAADSATRRNERRADELERSRVKLDREVARADRRAAADARRAALAERKLALAEQAQKVRQNKMDREPHKSTKAFKSASAKQG